MERVVPKPRHFENLIRTRLKFRRPYGTRFGNPGSHADWIGSGSACGETDLIQSKEQSHLDG